MYCISLTELYIYLYIVNSSFACILNFALQNAFYNNGIVRKINGLFTGGDNSGFTAQVSSHKN